MSSSANNTLKRKERKNKFVTKLINLLNENKGILFIQVDNVGSLQMQNVRVSLRGKATILMGKNTLIRKIIREQAEKNPKLNSILPYIVGNMGLVFTNEDLGSIRKIIEENKAPAPARVGIIAPSAVEIPAGSTGLDPGQTSFFQALNIATKIVKLAIEIVNPVILIKAGDRVNQSHVALLDKLNIKPFKYGIVVTDIYDDGSIYPVSVLDMSKDVLLQKFLTGVNTLAAVSVGLGYPTEASIKYYVSSAFSKVLAIALATDYSFPEAQKIRDILANPDAFRSSAPAAASSSSGSAAAPAAAKEPEPVEEEEDFGGFGLFD